MLDTTARAQPAIPTTPKVIHGQSIVYRTLSATDKALLVAHVCAGRVIFQPARSQRCRTLDVSVPMAAAAERLSPLERPAVKSGAVPLSKHLSPWHSVRTVATALKRDTDAELAAMLAPYADGLLPALDQITTPTGSTLRRNS